MYYATPAKLAIGAQLFGAPGIYVLLVFVVIHLAMVWSARWLIKPKKGLATLATKPNHTRSNSY